MYGESAQVDEHNGSGPLPRNESGYLYKMMMNRPIPYYKSGGKLCFLDREDPDARLKWVRVKSRDGIDGMTARYMTSHEKEK